MIIDESDAELGSLQRALDCGYHGTSHKNCKGVFKGLANRCYINFLNRKAGTESHLMSGEDLSNIGPVALLQDLAVQATLGNESLERNGHQYFAGLSMFPTAVQEAAKRAHEDLYSTGQNGWPTLRIENGDVSALSIREAPFGYGFRMDFSGMAPVPMA